MGTQKVGSDERVVALIHALIDRRLRLTKHEIRRSVPGYDRQNDAAFGRMFERDKETLRSWGIPLVADDDGHEAVYRIDLDAWPRQDVRLSAAELAVLGLATQSWNASQQRYAASDLAAAARFTAPKLAGRAAGPANSVAVDGVAEDLTVRLRDPGPAYTPLIDASARRQAVSFTYLAASTGQEAVRRVEPWRIVDYGRAYYVVGRDLDRDATRVFRLSRIRSGVETLGQPGAFQVPDQDDEWFVDQVRPRAATGGTAVLAVGAHRGHDLRSRALTVTAAPRGGEVGPLAGRDLVTLAVDDLDTLADEVTALGDGALVLEPARLRERVISRLRAIAVLDGGEHE